VIRANQADAESNDTGHNNAKRAQHFAVKTMSRVLGVSRSGYYDWSTREPAPRTLENASLTARIQEIHATSDETYGAPKIHAELRDADMLDHDPRWVTVGENRVARLMRVSGIRGVSRRRSFVVTTERNKKDRPAPDLVKREFVADAPNKLWVADITYVSTWAGFVYLAVVIDVWSRRVVGWQIGEQMTADLVINALNMALTQRKPESVIHHSDQGSQYTSLAFGKRCEQFGVRPSMGTVGDAYDNAMAESFFASLECELLNRRAFKTKSEARTALFTYIEGWYNPRRRHSGIDYLSPSDFERKHAPDASDAQQPSSLLSARVTHRPASACLLNEPERGPVDNPAEAFTDNIHAS
jgi:putative transposase